MKSTTSLDSVTHAAHAWLASFQDCVRQVDYVRARRLFCEDVVGFGSHAGHLHGLDDLSGRQWQAVWPNIEGFCFDSDRAVCHPSQAGDLVCISVPWRSTGFDANGLAFPRNGRATILLVFIGGAWRARHTHYSLLPGTPGYTQKPPV
jgi:ketosteroid isomerase-like protein